MTQPAQTVIVVETSYEQIVVDVGQLEDVQRILLGEFEIESLALDQIADFGLVLLGVAAVTDEQVDALPDGLKTRQAIVAHNAERNIRDDVTAFDVLTRLLRARYKEATDRDLEIGKNRDVDQLEALPHWGGGNGLPAVATAEQFRLHGAPRPVANGGVTIGVIDSALYVGPGLAGRVADADMVTSRPPRRAWEGHAAFVTGRILLRAPNATVLVRGVLDKNGMAKAWDVAYQMAALVRKGASVLNMALASYPKDGEEPFLIRRAVQKVNEKALIVAAAGNHGDGTAATVTEGRNGLAAQVLTTGPTAKAYPAASPGVVAVGAARVKEAEGGVTLIPAKFTPRVDWVQVWAPGVEQVSTFLEENVEARTAAVAGNVATITLTNLGNFNGYASWSGTSPATGDVSGEIARLAATDDLDGVQGALDAIRKRRAVGQADATDIRPAHGLEDWAEADQA
jgi:membrane-anchored mycosin MYCP